MNESTLNRMIREHKARIIWFLVFLILAVFVTALVFGTLKRSVQAQTYTKRVFACSYAQEGAEPVAHKHNDDCYENGELICTLPERELHIHGDECYAEEKVLVCTLEEGEGHVHTDACYTEKSVPVCGQEEDLGHTHSDACYTEEQVLVCGLEENDGHVHSVENGCYTRMQGDLICSNEDPEHVHNDDCYAWEEVLTCEIPEGEGAHHHDEQCYETQRILSCGQEEREPGHIHSDECYETQRVLSCGKEEGEGAHTHDDTCYEIQKVLICDKEEVKTEHVHTVDCFQVVDMTPEEIHALRLSELPESDPNADVESPDVWESRFASVPLSGHWDRDLLKIAETQLGYTESQRNFEAVPDEYGDGYTLKGWTRYGAWYGIPYGDWCAMFISFCLNYADIPESAVPYDCATTTWIDSLSARGMYAPAGSYDPKPGDLIFFDWEGDGLSDHVGIVWAVNSGSITTIEGNHTISVELFDYDLSDGHIQGYGILPENPALTVTDSEENENGSGENENQDKPEGGAASDAETSDSTDTSNIVDIEDTDKTEPNTETLVKMPPFSYSERVAGMRVSIEADEGAFPEGTTVTIKPIEDDGLAEQVAPAISGQVVKVQAVDITFYDADGNEIEPRIPIRVTMRPFNEPEADKVGVVHVDNDGVVSAVETQNDVAQPDQGIAFSADSFSTYALVYTVTFAYDGEGNVYQYSMPGGTGLSLRELLIDLGMKTEDNVDSYLSHVVNVDFSKPDCMTLTKEGNDWLLQSVHAFDTAESLTVTFDDYSMLAIPVTVSGIEELQLENASISSADGVFLPEGTEGYANVVEDTAETISAVEDYVEKNTPEPTLLQQLFSFGSKADENKDGSDKAYQVFDIGLDNIDTDSFKDGFNVEVKLPENVIGKDFHLYHIHDNNVEEIDLTLASTKVETGSDLVTGFSFQTDSFSTFTLSYTVDFHYHGAVYSIPGNTQILLTQLIEIMHITMPDNDETPDNAGNLENAEAPDNAENLDNAKDPDNAENLDSDKTSENDENLDSNKASENEALLDVHDVASVEFTDTHLVQVDQVSGLLTINGAEGKLTDVDAGDYNFLLSSLEPFSTEEKLTITLKDGTVIEVGVTDDQFCQVPVTLVKVGNVILNNRYYLQPYYWSDWRDPKTPLTGSDTQYNVQINQYATTLDNVRVCYNDNDNDTWRDAKNGEMLNGYIVSVIKDGEGFTVTLTKPADFKIKTEFFESDAETPSSTVPGDYYLLIKMVSDNGTYYALQSVDGSGIPSAPIVFKKYENNQLGGDGYYTGVETISTQVVTGVTGTDDENLMKAIQGSTGVVKYNENVVDGTQKSDMTKDIYSSSSEIVEEEGNYTMTTTFVRRKNDGVDHEIKVSFYENHTDSIENAMPDNTVSLDGTYFFRVKLFNSGKLVGYTIVPATKASNASGKGYLTTTISAGHDFTLVDDKGVDIRDSTLHYDPTVYTSEVRLYKLIGTSLPTKLDEVASKGDDKIPGYDFWQNVYSEEKAGATITTTRTDLGLYQQQDKIYQVKVVVEDGTELTNSDNIRLNVVADHATTQDQNLYGYDFVPSGSTSENGQRIYTVVIENKRDNISLWNVGQENTINGNEAFTLGISQNDTDLPDGYPIVLSKPNKEYVVRYDTEVNRETGKNIVVDDSTKVTTFTHYVYIREANLDEAIHPEYILGPGVYYGIAVDTFHNTGHIQSNFAVNNYYGSSPGEICPDLAKTADNTAVTGVIAAAHIMDRRMYLNINEGIGKALVFVDPSDEQYVTDTAGGNNKGKTYFIVPTEGSQISAGIVNPILNHGSAMSSILMSKEISFTPVPTGNGEIDLTMFPEGVTFYFDGDVFKDWIAQPEALKFIMNEDQVVVFNFDSTEEITINKTKMTVKGEDKDRVYVSEHVVYNCANASIVHLNETYGMILIPNSEAKIWIECSSEGWVISNGTLYQRNQGTEWHFRSKKMKKDTTASTSFGKRVDGRTPNHNEVFYFPLYKWVENDSGSHTDADWEPVATLKNVGPSMTYDVEMDQGRIFKIKEKESGKAPTTSGEYVYDKNEYYVLIRYVGQEVGSNILGLAAYPEYYSTFEAAYDVFRNGASATQEHKDSKIEGIVFNNQTVKGGLNIKKEVTGTANQDVDFKFELHVWNPNPDNLTYAYTGKISGTKGVTAWTASDTDKFPGQFTEGGITYDTTKVTFTLKAGETLNINSLPVDTHYAITELDNMPDMPEGYAYTKATKTQGGTTTTVNAPEKIISGIIPASSEGSVTVTFTNSYIYTYLDVEKKWSVDGVVTDDPGDGINEISFYLYRKADSVEEIIDSETKEGKTDKYDAQNPEGAHPFTITKTQKPDSSGYEWKLHIDGLKKTDDNGNDYTYWITEDQVDGYSVAITMVKDDETVNVGPGVEYVQAPAESTITITNSKYTISLPETGGPGTALYGLLGGLMAVTAGAVLTLRKKKNKA